MHQFFILLKKEIRELITLQMIVPLLLMVIAFVFIGKVIGSETSKAAKEKTKVAVIDLDKTLASANITALLQGSGYEPLPYPAEVLNIPEQDMLTKAQNDKAKALLIIPKGFEAGLGAETIPKIITYSFLRDFSLGGGQRANLAPVFAIINESFGNELIRKAAPNFEPSRLKAPVQFQEFTAVGTRSAPITMQQAVGFITSQSTLVPIIIFLVIAFAASLIAASVAGEKENKTLETLLSTPINRNALVAAKLVAAGLVAFFSAAIYLVGLRSYLQGMGAGAGEAVGNIASKANLAQLGLTMGVSDYLLLGGMLFLAILVALAIAMILGAFAEDTKSVQSVVTPLMMMVLIPYIMVFVLDLEQVSRPIKYFVYAIPFSHAFLAMPNILLERYNILLFGMGYLLVVFIIFVILAAKLFGSDKILTIRLAFKKKQN